jgi:hypothetical protein
MYCTSTVYVTICVMCGWGGIVYSVHTAQSDSASAEIMQP